MICFNTPAITFYEGLQKDIKINSIFTVYLLCGYVNSRIVFQVLILASVSVTALTQICYFDL